MSHLDSFDLYVKDVEKYIEEECKGKKIALVTHSMGGLIGLKVANNNKEIFT